MSFFTRLVPSMYQRRLWLLALAAAAVLLGLGAKLTRMTVVQGAKWRQRAEAAMSQRQLITTVRGTIYDRRRRELGVDRASCDVAVMYPVISDQWSYKLALEAARKAAGSSWFEMAPGERERSVAERKTYFDEQARLLWDTLAQIGGVDPGEVERRKQVIRERVQQIAGAVWTRRMEQPGADVDDQALTGSIQIGEQAAAHAILYDIDPVAKGQIESRISQAADERAHPELAVWRQVVIRDSHRRDYPLETMTVSVERNALPGPLRHEAPAEITVEGVGLPIIGQLRLLQGDDFKPGPNQCRRFRTVDGDGHEVIDPRGYLEGDQIGRWGIERSRERVLRGARGQIVERVDLDNASRTQKTQPHPGGDVVLSIDIRMQARVQAIMDRQIGLTVCQEWYQHLTEDDPHAAMRPKPGETLNGSAVVLDVATGQVLAAVGVPSISLRQMRQAPDEIWKDMVNRPWVNRPIAWPVEPGSTVKPMILAAAVTEQKLLPGELVTCNGFLDPHDPHHLRCWLYIAGHVGHGPIDGPTALAQSCDVFFYHMGQRLGVPLMAQWYQHFGMRRCLLGLGAQSQLSEELAGDLPTQGRGLDANDAAMLGIGQGPIRCTPLQVANAYATLARGGHWIDPTFILEEDGRIVTQAEGDLGLDPRGVAMVLAGMDRAVNAEGTGRVIVPLGREKIFTISGVHIMGKTGTADAAPLRLPSHPDGRPRSEDPIVRSGAHAWFVVLVQKPGSERPDYAVAVVVEYGGSGGGVAGPIVNQILLQMQAEGYL